MKAHGDSTAHPTQVAKPQPSDPRLLARLGGPRPPTPAGGNAKCGSLRRGGDPATPPHPKPLVRRPHVQEPSPQFLQHIHSKRPETTQTSNHRATVSQLWGSTAR